MAEKIKPVSSKDTAAEVDAFLATLDHPSKDVVVLLRSIIVGADPGIAEGIKWNVPSFRTSEYFATLHLRMKQGVGVILHFGAKKNAIADAGVDIPDPGGLLTWLAKDRALVAFVDLADLQAKRSAFVAVVREWIRHL